MKPQKFKLVADPVRHDLSYYESAICDIMSGETLTLERAQDLCEHFECILTKAFYALYGIRTDMDGLRVEKVDCARDKVTLEGEVFWLQGDGLGHCFKIDVARSAEPLLYSFKLYDFPDAMKQTIYVAKMHDCWVVDRPCIPLCAQGRQSE